MRIVVTGASGFVGRALVDELAFHHNYGIAVSRRVIGGVPNGWDWAGRDCVLRGLRPKEAIDAVVHLEVKQHVFNPTKRDITEFEKVNVGGTQEWLEWCSRIGVNRFVYFSTIKAVRSELIGATFESAEPSRDCGYGESKWKAEEQVRNWVNADSQRAAIIFRPAVIYGPGNVGNIGAMVRAVMRNQFFLVGPGQNRKSVVSLRNVAAACRYLVDRMVSGACEVFNVVDPVTLPLREFDALVRRAAGKSGGSPRLPSLVGWSAAKVGDIVGRLSGITFPINTSRLRALCEHSEFSCDKLIATGFQHPQSTEEGIAEMVSWFRSRAN